MTPWPEQRAEHLKEIEEAARRLREVMADPQLLHRVRQAVSRAQEQMQVASDLLSQQDHPR